MLSEIDAHHSIIHLAFRHIIIHQHLDILLFYVCLLIYPYTILFTANIDL